MLSDRLLTAAANPPRNQPALWGSLSEKMVQDATNNPYAGDRPAVPAIAPARPTTVEAAFWLLLAAAALVLIRIPVGIWAVNKEEHKSFIENGLGPDNVPIWVGGEISGYVWSGVITAVILAAIAMLSRMGLGWPRIVLVVVVIFTTLNTRVQFFASLVTVYETAWVTLASVLLSLAAAVLLFLKPSNAYFRSTGAYRKGRKLSQA
ncbi:hypothetical protein AAE021_14295 [Arthrobacter citreus]|uniref:Uncharacterized protein n=1 Tax=Arthrobacter citreus TaxID=1670 RepID=A0ABZ2ZWW8_9MICC